ncbi:hypothetical protein RSOLAG22IIIB_07878 [Rhizoctonia solani]|uniref:Fungal lipase-type domain-containing protein n=1 Tax=Rhizoctonia solani TaxID=456999 RepID=A0A0K6FQ40_9AGAM|nr:hypothetical protein RSOLAG22IIIB_07878 [Rhizoctonia solani]
MEVAATSGENPTDAGWFVGYDPTLNPIVVSNQGTSPSEALASLTDADFFLTPLDPTRFPGVSPSIQVHNGFEIDQATHAQKKLDAVKTLLSKYGPSSITLTGLGRGGAISFIDAIYLQLHTGAKIKVVTHGMPRVGNKEFADYVDAHLDDVSRITNMKDPLPILPGRFLGYAHSSGEKHILSDNAWIACPGQDNTDPQCSTGDVPNIFEGNLEDNRGPYNGIIIDDRACDAQAEG